MEGSIKIVWLFAVLYILNHGIAFTVDCSIGDLKLGGKATRALRTGIFSVMLQVSGVEGSRSSDCTHSLPPPPPPFGLACASNLR